MKKIIAGVLLILAFAAPSYAVNIVDTMLCTPVVLRYNSKTVLVNRFSGEVKYVMTNGQYVPLVGVYKRQLQAIYNAQKNSGKTKSAQ